MDKQTLISTLKDQHRTLQKKLQEVHTNALHGAPAEQITNSLSDFEQHLIEHLNLENSTFYPDYFKVKAQIMTQIEEGHKLVAEMDEIAKKINAFLETYKTSNAIDLSRNKFISDLISVINTLNVRIETEEEGIFNLYLALDSGAALKI